ncbi:DUF1073 domain-containing protein [Parvularcula flava]|uniref:DUF1073 domain-containing protein n=1 Tax=Aquisalinus luteolus TaxID=1566827 RepID=A0A8J3A3D4_9PROT|nr:anti-CBASS Acb1 family protein [Aquisalinus luteolus]NHK29182.1 DUF1073 domain-containing protein [Aquisalinus luteolus]GGI00051.1 hypothetical protein GCM10011355_27430 [Aquisalinus luteolus]
MSKVSMIANAVQRSLGTMFPGYFSGTTKRNHYADFGYPEAISFDMFWQMYQRTGYGKAAVERYVGKTWEDLPSLQTDEKTREMNKVEQALFDRFRDLRAWPKIVEADRRSLVGKYSAIILRLADGQGMDKPVGRVNGLDGLIEIIPAWEGQLTISDWYSDINDENYGKPKMFQFNEQGVGSDNKQKVRNFNVHPDRVIVWSNDGTVHADNFLSAGFNDLISIEKIIGAGGEGFWKNAKAGLFLEIDKEANIEAMAKAMQVSPGELAEAMDDQVNDFQTGIDAYLLMQGMTAKNQQITLPSPEHFILAPVQSFAASVSMPTKILTGMQSGERASSEDQEDWEKTISSRRDRETVPNIMELVNRLVQFRVLPEEDWSIDWPELGEASPAEKIARADKMADINVKHMNAGGAAPVFDGNEVREAAGYEPVEGVDDIEDDTDTGPPDSEEDDDQ